MKSKRGRTARLPGRKGLDIPPFSRWVPIADRRSLPGIQERGLYIVGRFDRCPRGAAKPLHRNVIYIGETHGPRMSIRRRLDYFARAAIHGRAKHSGGWRCFRTFGADPPDLHVAALPIIEPDQQRLEALIFAIERTLIAAYADRWGTMPVCNVSAGKGSEIGFEKTEPPAYVVAA